MVVSYYSIFDINNSYFTSSLYRHLLRGAHIEARDKEGLTPLVTAAAWGHPKSVTLLLEKGADVNARDKRENSATFAAIQENNPRVMKIILEAGGERLIDTELDR